MNQGGSEGQAAGTVAYGQGSLQLQTASRFCEHTDLGQGHREWIVAVLQSPIFPLPSESKVGSAGCGRASSCALMWPSNGNFAVHFNNGPEKYLHL